MTKQEKEYQKLYGHITKNENLMLGELLSSLKLSNNTRKNVIPLLQRGLDMKWKSVDFTIYLLPKATPRPRANFRSNIFYVSGAKDNKKLFEKFIKNIDIPMITTPCKFRCYSYFPIPSSMREDEKILAELGFIRPVSKPDWDNLAKAYCDMIQGTLIYDDCLVVEGISKKYYSIKPRIEVRLEYMEDYDSQFNEKKFRKKVK